MKIMLRSAISLFITVAVYQNASAQGISALWASSFGGANNEVVTAITSDAGGNLYITGNFESTSLTLGSFTLYNPGMAGIFTAKLDPSGNVQWLKGATGTGAYCTGTGICTDINGNIIITGYFFSSLSVSFGPYNIINAWFTEQTFTVKYDPAGNEVWAEGAGDYDTDASSAVASDGAGNLYITGFFSGDSSVFDNITIYNTSPGTGNPNVFFAKYDPNGAVLWAEAMMGSGFGNAVTTDAIGNIFFAGNFYGATASAGGIALNGTTGSNSFIVQYNASGTAQWARCTAYAGEDIVMSLATDVSGNVYLGGYFEGDTLSFGASSLLNSCDSLADGYLVKLDPNGNPLWARSVGGDSKDVIGSIATDAGGNVYAGGYYMSDSIQLGNHVLYNGGSYTKDIFMLKCDSSGNMPWIKSAGGSGSEYFPFVTTTTGGDLAITSMFDSPTLTLGNFNLTCWGTNDIFIARLGACSAYFTVFPDTIPHNWIALNQSNGILPISYTWNWGDGNTSSGATPNHTYSSPGNYNICLSLADGAGCTSQYCDSGTYLYKGSSGSMVSISVISSGATGIKAPDGLQQIIFYPNPATQTGIIATTGLTGRITITLYDLSGKCVYTATHQPSDRLLLDISLLEKGVYMLEVVSEGYTGVRKVVVED